MIHFTKIEQPGTDQAEARWHTRLDPRHTRAFGCDECHAVIFAPGGDRDGPNSAACLQIPEASDSEIAHALRWASEYRTRVLAICDTSQQAEAFAALAAKELPDHRRVPLETASVGKWGPAS